MYISGLRAYSLSSNNAPNVGHGLLKAFHGLSTVLNALEHLIVFTLATVQLRTWRLREVKGLAQELFHSEPRGQGF